MDFFGIYSWPAALEMVAKICCIVHVIRSGRSFLWITLILFLPFAGPLIYFFLEVLPDLRGNGGGGRGGFRMRRGDGGDAGFQFPQTSARAIQKMRDQLEFSNTTANRTRLARALAAAKRYPEALETLNDCLKGVFKDDPLLTYERAQVYFAAGQFDAALDDLRLLDSVRSRHAAPARVLLAARCYQALGGVARLRRSGDGRLGRGGALSVCGVAFEEWAHRGSEAVVQGNHRPRETRRPALPAVEQRVDQDGEDARVSVTRRGLAR